jgi:hypothetical protein
MTTWRCPRCTYTSVQPAHVTGMRHHCTPPGRPAKEVELRPDSHEPKAA